jgi:hypothetical protein
MMLPDPSIVNRVIQDALVFVLFWGTWLVAGMVLAFLIWLLLVLVDDLLFGGHNQRAR